MNVKHLYTLQLTNNGFYSTYHNKQIVFGFHDIYNARKCRDAIVNHYNMNGNWLNQCAHMTQIKDQTYRMVLRENKEHEKTDNTFDMFVNFYDLEDFSNCKTIENMYNVSSINFLIIGSMHYITDMKQLVVDGIYIEKDFQINTENKNEFLESLEKTYKKN